MATTETHGLGYERVDDDPNVSILLDTMDATAGWEATRRLRAWERRRLGLTSGQRLLDVGCGLGDVVLALADGLGANGEIVGVDASTEMVAAAGSRASTARCRVRFEVGDATTLSEPDDHFDVVRSERTLQWLRDPDAAVAEMSRVLRPGGLVSLIDTDWSTFEIDVGDDDLARRVRAAMQTQQGRPSNIGSRLPGLVRNLGFELVAETAATQTWSSWNPDATPAPEGCFSMSSLADDLVDTGQLKAADRQRFVATIHQAARDGRFSMALTMFAVVARAPTMGLRTQRPVLTVAGGGLTNRSATRAGDRPGSCVAVPTDPHIVESFAQGDHPVATWTGWAADDRGAVVAQLVDQSQDHRERGGGAVTGEQFGCRFQGQGQLVDVSGFDDGGRDRGRRGLSGEIGIDRGDNRDQRRDRVTADVVRALPAAWPAVPVAERDLALVPAAGHRPVGERNTASRTNRPRVVHACDLAVTSSAARRRDPCCARCSQPQQQISNHSGSRRPSRAQHGQVAGHGGRQAATFRSPAADVFDDPAHHLPVGVRIERGDRGGDSADRVEERV